MNEIIKVFFPTYKKNMPRINVRFFKSKAYKAKKKSLGRISTAILFLRIFIPVLQCNTVAYFVRSCDFIW